MANIAFPQEETFLKRIEGEQHLRFFQINYFDSNFFVELLVKPGNKIVKPSEEQLIVPV